MGWQPIETAPKDDTDVLVYREGRIHVGRYNSFWQRWGVFAERIPGDQTPFLDIDDVGTEGYYAARGPTHWMPLPKPPAEKDPNR